MRKTIIENYVLDIADYCEEIGLSRNDYTLNEFEKILQDLNCNLWNYPINEIEYLIKNNNKKIVLVRFPEIYGGYEYRWCELDNIYENKEN